MAEIIGVMASGAGLLALSIQLGECAFKLKTFYDRVKNAPTLLLDLSHELETISLILQGLEKHRRDDGLDDTLLRRCILRCREKVAEIQLLVIQLESRNNSLDRLGRIHTAFKDESIEKILAHLERAKTSIMLAFQAYSWAQQCQYSEEQSRSSHNMSNILVAHSTQLDRLEEGSAAQTALLQQSAISKSGSQEQRSVRVVSHNADDLPTTAAQKRRRHPRKRNYDYRARIGLPFWLTSQVWDLAASRAASGWNFSIRSYNIRSRSSEVFEYCVDGDLRSIQRLISNREASPFDCDLFGTTLLEKAASAQELEICRMLLEEAGPVDNGLLRQMLDGAITGSSEKGKREHDLYRLIIEDFGADVDFEDIFSQHDLWGPSVPVTRLNWLCNFSTSPECIDVLRKHQNYDWNSQSEELRIESTLRIMDFRGYWPTHLFLRWLDLDAPTRSLAEFRASNGNTVLHYAAIWLAWTLSCNLKSGDPQLAEIKALCLALLRLGSEPLAICASGLTPLMTALFSPEADRRNIELYLRIVQCWISLLDEVGMNTEEYRKMETRMWDHHGGMSTPSGRRGTLVQRPVLHQSAESCNVMICRSANVPVYEIRAPPGRWLASIHQTTKICWEPDDTEWGEGYWGLSSLTTKLSNVLNVRDEISEVAVWAELHVRKEINGAQDDARLIALRIPSIGRRESGRRRSTSQPPPLYRRQLAYYSKESDYRPRISSCGHDWVPTYHLCPADNKVHFHQDFSYQVGTLRDGVSRGLMSVRDCMKGTYPQETPVQTSEAWEKHSFMGSCPDCCDPTLAKELYETS